MLAQRNLVPLHVAFDRRLLVGMVDWLVRFALQPEPLASIPFRAEHAWILYVGILHYVLVEKGANVTQSLGSGHFGLHFVTLRLEKAPKPDGVTTHLADLHRATLRAGEEWIRLRDTGRIDPSSIAQIPSFFYLCVMVSGAGICMCPAAGNI